MKVPLLDLKRQYLNIKEQIVKTTLEVYEEQRFILGPKVQELEEKIACYCQAKWAVGVSSGTDALLMALMTGGVGCGDEVITTPYTFFATIGSIVRAGAVPIFSDIDEETYNLDPKGLEEKITEKTKAIIPVHLYGQCCDMDPIMKIAQSRGLAVIEDAAQAIGSEYKGQRAGSMGLFGCFSFFPSKNLGAFGDGGMVTTSDESLHERLKVMRVHGSKPKYYHQFVGGNFRLDALQAAIILVKLAFLDEWTAARQENAARYRALFKRKGLDGFVKLPGERNGRHIYNQFVISVPERRDELKTFLQEVGISTEIYYPVPMHLQPCFKDFGGKLGDFPKAESAASNTLAIPVYPELTEEEQAYVVEKIRIFYN